MSKSYWDQKLNDYSQEEWASKPSIFAEQVLKYFPRKGKILELAAGYGQDGRFFSEQGYEVVQTDFSDTGRKFLETNKTEGMNVAQQDLTQQLKFADGEFDVVYCHLGIHYFSWDQTEEIVKEIKRVLRPGGIIALFTNSTDDPEISEGEQIEENFYHFDKLDKRYFNLKDMGKLMEGFKTLLLDNKGTTYKDSKIGVNNLIRYIGKR